MMTKEEMAPLPPAYSKRRFRPMAWRDVQFWLERYNAFVEVWNRHEMDRSLPLAARWAEADMIFDPGLPASALTFRPHGQEAVAIRLRRWQRFAPGWSFCRVPAPLERVIWAAWEP